MSSLPAALVWNATSAFAPAAATTGRTSEPPSESALPAATTRPSSSTVAPLILFTFATFSDHTTTWSAPFHATPGCAATPGTRERRRRIEDRAARSNAARTATAPWSLHATSQFEPSHDTAGSASPAAISMPFGSSTVPSCLTRAPIDVAVAVARVVPDEERDGAVVGGRGLVLVAHGGELHGIDRGARSDAEARPRGGGAAKNEQADERRCGGASAWGILAGAQSASRGKLLERVAAGPDGRFDGSKPAGRRAHK